MSKLLDFQKGPSRTLEVRNKSDSVAELIIYANIGKKFWPEDDTVSAKEVSDALSKLSSSVKELNIRINSPGGDVFEGVAIYNRLKELKIKKTVQIDGLAASIASVIALAGDEIVIGEGAMYMIHLPWTFAMGNRMEMENTINLLMEVEEQIIGIYARRTKISRMEIKKMLEADNGVGTWMDATEAKKKGFVDKTMEASVPIAASALKQPWILKAPAIENTSGKAAKKKAAELKLKIEGTLARK